MRMLSCLHTCRNLIWLMIIMRSRCQSRCLDDSLLFLGCGADWAVSPMSRILTVAYLIVGAPIIYLYVVTAGRAIASALHFAAYQVGGIAWPRSFRLWSLSNSFVPDFMLWWRRQRQETTSAAAAAERRQRRAGKQPGSQAIAISGKLSLSCEAAATAIFWHFYFVSSIGYTINSVASLARNEPLPVQTPFCRSASINSNGGVSSGGGGIGGGNGRTTWQTKGGSASSSTLIVPNGSLNSALSDALPAEYEPMGKPRIAVPIIW